MFNVQSTLQIAEGGWLEICPCTPYFVMILCSDSKRRISSSAYTLHLVDSYDPLPEQNSRLSYNILTPLVTHPDLVDFPSIDIHPLSNSKGLLLWMFIIRVCNRKGASTDQMGSETIVSMRWIVSFAI